MDNKLLICMTEKVIIRSKNKIYDENSSLLYKGCKWFLWLLMYLIDRNKNASKLRLNIAKIYRFKTSRINTSLRGVFCVALASMTFV